MKVNIYNKSEIIEEYNLALLEAKEEYEMAKWGSSESMLNRFRFFFRKVNTLGSSILDIGSGTGAFYHYLYSQNYTGKYLGLDISDEMINYALNNKLKDEIYENIDFLEFNTLEKFGIVTMFGVLQKTNHSNGEIFKKIYSLLSDCGIFFFTTKNINWKEFERNDFFPEEGHNWFDHRILQSELGNSGFKIIEKGGFLPKENREVGLRESHTIFFMVRKEEK